MGTIEPPFDSADDVPEWAQEDAAVAELCRRDFEFRIQCELAETAAERQKCKREALPLLEEIMLADWRSLPGVVLGPMEHNWQLEAVRSEKSRLIREFVCGFCGHIEFEIDTLDGQVWTETDAPHACPGSIV